MGKINVSVVIPSYNEERYIGRCLDSLLQQTLTGFEIIIVDDGSTDRTKQIVKNYPVRLIEQNHLGPGAARNRGAAEANGQILVFVDADMFFDAHYLEYLVKPVKNGKAIATFHKEEFIGNPENKWAVCWNIEHSRSLTRRVAESHPDVMDIYRSILKDRFLTVGGFDPSAGYEDDSTLYPKLGIMAVYAPGAVCYHNNPSTPSEVFQSAQWIGRSRKYRRPRKIVRHMLPFSIIFAIKGTIQYRVPWFLIFKPFHDLATVVGWMSRILSRKNVK